MIFTGKYGNMNFRIKMTYHQLIIFVQCIDVDHCYSDTIEAVEKSNFVGVSKAFKRY